MCWTSQSHRTNPHSASSPGNAYPDLEIEVGPELFLEEGQEPTLLDVSRSNSNNVSDGAVALAGCHVVCILEQTEVAS
jgi:hypothetical protein